MSDYFFVKIDHKFMGEFISAWENAFDRVLEKAIYDWIFDGKNLIYAFLFDDKVVAGYCLYPLECILNKERKTALLCNNVFVSPSHQAKNLFVKLGRLALNDAGVKGLGDIAYGIPNRLALPGHKRVGWEIKPKINFISAKRKQSTTYGLTFKKGMLTESEKKAIEQCSLVSSKSRDFSVLKTLEFVDWRFERKPNTSYWYGFEYNDNELVAYCVCKYFSDKKTLHFVDIDGFDSTAISKLIVSAHNIPEDFDRLNVWDSTAHKDIFLGCDFKEENLTDNLIFINPADVSNTFFLDNVNVTLSDNDVY